MDEELFLDRAHLARQTAGDDALAGELLALFEGQCRRLLPGLREPAAATSDRADLAHTLKGSALGVGAGRLAALAAAIETRLRAGSDVSASGLDELERTAQATLAEARR